MFKLHHRGTDTLLKKETGLYQLQQLGRIFQLDVCIQSSAIACTTPYWSLLRLFLSRSLKNIQILFEPNVHKYQSGLPLQLTFSIFCKDKITQMNFVNCKGLQNDSGSTIEKISFVIILTSSNCRSSSSIAMLSTKTFWHSLKFPILQLSQLHILTLIWYVPSAKKEIILALIQPGIGRPSHLIFLASSRSWTGIVA